MLPHQVRAVEEKNELDEKICKLELFFNTPTFLDLPESEQGRLRKQLFYMSEYSAILGERIRFFTK
jgi:hypothetical protein